LTNDNPPKSKLHDTIDRKTSWPGHTHPAVFQDDKMDKKSSTFGQQLLRKGADYRWLLVGGLGLLALGLGFYGFSRHFEGSRSPWDILYLSIQLFVLESGSVEVRGNPALEIARLLAPVVSGYAVLQALMIVFKEQVQVFRLRFCRDHVIICGLGRKGTRLAQGFLIRGDRVVLIEADPGNSQIRLFREKGALVLVGDAKDPYLLAQARVNRAACLLSVCGDDDTNAEVALAARGLVPPASPRVLTCIVHLVDPELYRLLRQLEIEAPAVLGLRLTLFNVYERGAWALFKRYPVLEPVPGGGRSQAPHLVFIGLGRLGEALVAQAARVWWLGRREDSPRLRLTVVDKAAEEKMKALMLRYPRLPEACEIKACSLEVPSADFLTATQLFSPPGVNEQQIAIVSLEPDGAALSLALDLARRLSPLQIPIVVSLMEDSGLMGLLRQAEGEGVSSNLRPFNLLDETCTTELILGGTHEILARAIHDDYIRQEQAKGNTPETNPSMAPWDELPEEFKEDNRKAADAIAQKLDTIGCRIITMEDWDARFSFSPDEVEKLAVMEHERWMADKFRAGWRFAPGDKDIEGRTNPCLVPWHELTEEAKEKDRQQVRSLPAFLEYEGFQIIRFPHPGS
jgi:voltage-gated potassium channel Kch